MRLFGILGTISVIITILVFVTGIESLPDLINSFFQEPSNESVPEIKKPVSYGKGIQVPEDQGYFEEGLALLQKHNFAEADINFQKAIQLNPDNNEYKEAVGEKYFQIGMQYYKDNNFLYAKDYFEKACDYCSDNIEFKKALEDVLKELPIEIQIGKALEEEKGIRDKIENKY